MPETLQSGLIGPFEGASELNAANSLLIARLEGLLGSHASRKDEPAALVQLAPQIREFVARGAATGRVIEDIEQRTACQVLIDYWTTSLARTGAEVERRRLDAFDVAALPHLDESDRPFVGLDAHRDGRCFFGRGKAVQSLVERVLATPLVVVQGASGSGKSSLVMGGALPRLCADDHRPAFRCVGPFAPGDAVLDHLVAAIEVARPGEPMDAKAEVASLRADASRLAALAGADEPRPLLVVVDQFEEVFTLSTPGDRDALVRNLVHLLEQRTDHRVLLTMREEFANELDLLAPLAPYLTEARHARFSMKEWRMGYEDLKAAVEEPARKVNLQFAPGIVDEMVKSVLLSGDTALPLLQFMLERLWSERERNRITRAVFDRVRGAPEQPGTPNPVHVVFRRDADAFFEGLLPELQTEVRRILLELVDVDRLLEPYRRPMLRSRLLQGAAVRERALEALDKLVAKGFVRVTPAAGGADAAVEVRHEALLRNWPRYTGWINEKRERVRRHVALADSAQRWDRSADKSQGLLNEWQLRELEGLGDLSPLETAYCRASQEAVDRAREAQVAAARRQGVRKAASIAVASAVLVAGVVAGFWNWSKGRQEARASQTQAVLLQFARANDASARGALDHALGGALEGVVAMRQADPAVASSSLARSEARRTLLSVLRGADDVRRLFVAPQRVFHAVAFHPLREEGIVAYAGSGGEVHLAQLGGLPAAVPPLGKSLPACGTALVSTVAFDPKGRWLAAGCADGTLSIWSTTDWTPRGRIERIFAGRPIWTVAAHHGGRLLAVGGYENHVRLVALAEDGTPESNEPVQAGGPDVPHGFVWSLAFAPADDLLLVGDGVGSVLACRGAQIGSWTCRRSNLFPGEPDKEAGSTDAIRALAFSPDGSFVAIGRWNGGVDLVDAKFTAKRRPPLDVDEVPGPVLSLAFQQACNRTQLAIGKGSGLVYRAVAAADDGAAPDAVRCATRASIGDEVYGVAWHAPSGLLAAATRGGYVAVLAPPGEREDPLRRRVSSPSTPQPTSQRAAIVGVDGPLTRVVVRSEDARRRTQLSLLTLLDGRPSDAPPLPIADLEGRDVRLAGHEGRRLLAVLKPGAAPEVTVQPLDERFTALQAPLRVLGPAQFEQRSPTRVAFSPDGRWLVLAFGTRRAAGTSTPAARPLLLASVDDPRRDRWIRTELHGSIEIAFSADGKHFAAGGDAVQPQAGAGVGQVQVWPVVAEGLKDDGPRSMRLGPQANVVYDLAFVADGRRPTLLLAGGEYGLIERWRVDTQERLEPLHADSRAVLQLAYSPATSLVAAADSPNVVRIWEDGAGEPLALSRPEDRIDSPGFLAFGGNGAWLLNAGRGGVQVWDVEIEKLRDKACALLREPGQHGAEAPRPSARGTRCARP